VRVLVTGHTGFKGSWLTFLLQARGVEVGGLSLPPRPGALSARCDNLRALPFNRFTDIRDLAAVRSALSSFRPNVVVHLAAQALVLDGVSKPHETVDVNVNGTLNVLEAARSVETIEQIVVVSTDKVYRNDGRLDGYPETAPLGGSDPYSASKAAADLIAQAWATTLDYPKLSICRAGNVIGGGDDSPQRLLPDIIRSLSCNEPVSLRSPDSVRPWQHVLDCLSGYVTLVERRAELQGLEVFNFGPSSGLLHSVLDVAYMAMEEWGETGKVQPVTFSGTNKHEAQTLSLNAELAAERLSWQPQFSVREAVQATIAWERATLEGSPPEEVTRGQVDEFLQWHPKGQLK
jgi:CDP-glucose 4,6-dehydratase